MWFNIIQGFHQAGQEKQNVDKRLEAFHHFWTFLLDKNRVKSLLLTSHKFESHRSLLLKVKNFLLREAKLHRAKKNIETHYFSHHQYFGDSNLLIRSVLGLSKIIKEARVLFSKEDSTFSELISKIEEIEKVFFVDQSYINLLSDKLIGILHLDEPIKPSVLTDIKFLVNALIVELFHVGYSMEYLRKLPNIILLGSNKTEFPYNKGEADFENWDLYKEYVNLERKNWTLEKMLNGFKNLSSKPKYKGFYIFKVRGINYEFEESIKIWGCEFYNPQKKLKIWQGHQEEYWNKLSRNVELFMDDQFSDNAPSTCNLMVPAEFLQIRSTNYPDLSIKQAFKEGQRVIAVFNDLLNKNNQWINKGKGTIEISKHFLMFDNYRYAYSSLTNYSRKENVDFKIDEPLQREFLVEELERLNHLNPKNEFHQNLIETNAILRRLKNEPETFSFKELWISIVEPLFSIPSESKKLKKFILLCFKRRFDLHFINYSMGFMATSLGEYKGFTTDPSCYFLNEEDYQKLGLHLEIGQKIIANTEYRHNFTSIKDKVKSPILDEIIDEISNFNENRSSYYENLKSWVNKTIDQVYHERNFEVHNNFNDELSTLKLQGDFIYIVNVFSGSIMDQIQRGTTEREEIIENIESYNQTYS